MSKTNISVVTDGALLNKRINETAKMYLAAGRRIHVDFVSALWYVAAHGNAFYLNRIYALLRTNDKQAAKLYIRRAAAVVGLEGENPDGLPAEVIKAAVEAGSVVKLEKDEFSVVAGNNTKQAQMLRELCETRFIEPDGKNDFMLLDRNNFAEVKTLGDNEAFKQLAKLVKSLEEGDTDNRKVSVTEPVLKFFQRVRDEMEVLKNQVTLNEG